MLLFSFQVASVKPPLYPHLAAEINQMTDVDQDVRMKYIDAKAAKKSDLPEIVKKMTDIDHADTERMKWIVDEFGWPTPEMVGREGSENAWLLVQHASADPPFQKKCLKLIEPLAKKGIVSGSNYAYLFDRIQVMDGKLQRFGTQGKDENGVMWIQPVEDPRRVDGYRKAYGLDSIESYAKMLAEAYKEKLAPDWRERMKPDQHERK